MNDEHLYRQVITDQRLLTEEAYLGNVFVSHSELQ